MGPPGLVKMRLQRDDNSPNSSKGIDRGESENATVKATKVSRRKEIRHTF